MIFLKIVISSTYRLET